METKTPKPVPTPAKILSVREAIKKRLASVNSKCVTCGSKTHIGASITKFYEPVALASDVATLLELLEKAEKALTHYLIKDYDSATETDGQIACAAEEMLKFVCFILDAPMETP